jgi:predicted regulator of Ras-like GTPase activity (Roadblock/LC7/MglB family)
MVRPGHPTEQRLGRLLEDLKKSVPGARQVLLLSPDGLRRVGVDLSPGNADRLAAIAAALNSLGHCYCHERVLGNGGDVRQVTVELTNGLLVVVSAGHDTVLAVTTNARTPAAKLTRELGRLVRAVQEVLGASGRRNSSLCPGR